jgi:hypothetical protein
MRPLSGEEFAVEFTASRELRDKILKARALVCHSVPDGDLAKIFEKGLDLLIAKVEKERFGVGRKARERAGRVSDRPEPTLKEDAGASPTSADSGVREERRAGSAAVDASDPLDGVAPSTPTASVEAPAPQSGSRHIPAAIKRAVYERDGGRCTFVDDQGRRCTSTQVQFDHADGFAWTRMHSVDNIRLRCPAHNQSAADEMYGREFMDRARTKAPPAPADTDPATRPGTS